MPLDREQTDDEGSEGSLQDRWTDTYRPRSRTNLANVWDDPTYEPQVTGERRAKLRRNLAAKIRELQKKGEVPADAAPARRASA